MKLLLVDDTKPRWWLVNISSCNGVVPSGSKSLPVPILTKFHVFINEWHNEAINPKVQKISNHILGLSYADVGLVNMYPKLRKTKITFLFRNNFATENIFFPGYQSITHNQSYTLCLYILWMQVAE